MRCVVLLLLPRGSVPLLSLCILLFVAIGLKILQNVWLFLFFLVCVGNVEVVIIYSSDSVFPAFHPKYLSLFDVDI